jgi:hypothetical protein
MTTVGNLTVGTRLQSVVSTVQVIVMRCEGDVRELECGGYPMTRIGTDVPPADSSADPLEGRVELGKRYSSDEPALSVLCTKAGDGTLTVGGHPLTLEAAKVLPASD